MVSLWCWARLRFWVGVGIHLLLHLRSCLCVGSFGVLVGVDLVIAPLYACDGGCSARLGAVYDLGVDACAAALGWSRCRRCGRLPLAPREGLCAVFQVATLGASWGLSGMWVTPSACDAPALGWRRPCGLHRHWHPHLVGDEWPTPFRLASAS